MLRAVYSTPLRSHRRVRRSKSAPSFSAARVRMTASVGEARRVGSAHKPRIIALYNRRASEVRALAPIAKAPARQRHRLKLYRRLLGYVRPYKGVFGAAIAGMLLVA